MAGPWFAVHRDGAGWKLLDEILVSDGERHVLARVESRVRLVR